MQKENGWTYNQAKLYLSGGGFTIYTTQELIDDLKTAIRLDAFYYNCKIDNTKALAYDDILSPYAFYDANNRANKFTISQIDFDSSDIDVVRSSKL